MLFFNQALHFFLCCQFIYDFALEKEVTNVISETLIHLYFIAILYYMMAAENLFNLNAAYYCLREVSFNSLGYQLGNMGDSTDIIIFILSQFQYETPSTEKTYSSAFEINVEGSN